MYITFRRYRIDPANAAEIVRLVNQGFVPILSKAVGFISYVIYSDEENRICSVSQFMTRAGMEEANEMAREWVEEHLAPLMPNPPEVSQGESRLFHRTKMIVPS